MHASLDDALLVEGISQSLVQVSVGRLNDVDRLMVRERESIQHLLVRHPRLHKHRVRRGRAVERDICLWVSRVEELDFVTKIPDLCLCRTIRIRGRRRSRELQFAENIGGCLLHDRGVPGVERRDGDQAGACGQKFCGKRRLIGECIVERRLRGIDLLLRLVDLCLILQARHNLEFLLRLLKRNGSVIGVLCGNLTVRVRLVVCGVGGLQLGIALRRGHPLQRLDGRTGHCIPELLVGERAVCPADLRRDPVSHDLCLRSLGDGDERMSASTTESAVERIGQRLGQGGSEFRSLLSLKSTSNAVCQRCSAFFRSLRTIRKSDTRSELHRRVHVLHLCGGSTTPHACANLGSSLRAEPLGSSLDHAALQGSDVLPARSVDAVLPRHLAFDECVVVFVGSAASALEEERRGGDLRGENAEGDVGNAVRDCGSHLVRECVGCDGGSLCHPASESLDACHRVDLVRDDHLQRRGSTTGGCCGHPGKRPADGVANAASGLTLAITVHEHLFCQLPRLLVAKNLRHHHAERFACTAIPERRETAGSHSASDLASGLWSASARYADLALLLPHLLGNVLVGRRELDGLCDVLV